jgi:hypothetical protein
MHPASDRIAVPTEWARRLSIAILLSAFALGAQAQNKCSATGAMAGLKFAANNCVAALSSGQHSVAVWFNEDPISAEEARDFEASGTVDGAKNGKQRTLVLIMFCPGGGAAAASAGAVKAMTLTTNHAKSLLVGIQWTVKPPKDFKVENLTGEVKPGGKLAGRIAGKWHKTTWDLTFDLKLPATDTAQAMDCGR